MYQVTVEGLVLSISEKNSRRDGSGKPCYDVTLFQEASETTLKVRIAKDSGTRLPEKGKMATLTGKLNAFAKDKDGNYVRVGTMLTIGDI